MIHKGGCRAVGCMQKACSVFFFLERQDSFGGLFVVVCVYTVFILDLPH
jgi:hypothetical protein